MKICRKISENSSDNNENSFKKSVTNHLKISNKSMEIREKMNKNSQEN